jgi:hypothetical protein
MTIPASTVPAAKAALYSGALTAINDPAVLVCYDEPGPNQPDDIVCIGPVERDVTIGGLVGGGGAGWLTERYAIHVIVSCFRGGDDAKTVFERAAALADVVVNVVRTDPSLGDAVITAQPTKWLLEGTWEAEHKGRVATATGHIECTARI